MGDFEGRLQYAIDYLTPAMKEVARDQLHETEENKARCLKEMKELIKKETNLRTPSDDAFIMRYLRARKYKTKEAFALLQSYWGFRGQESAALEASDFDKIKQILLRNFIGPLPFRDKFGSVVYIFRVGEWNTSLDTLPEMISTITGTLIHSVQYPATQVCGYRIILDLRNINMSHVKMATPANAKLLFYSTQVSFPARYKGFHFIAKGKLYKLVWPVLYSIMTPKMRKRIHMHGSDLSELRKVIDPSVLPKEFGGDAGPIDMGMWDQLIDDCREDMLDLLNYGYHK